MGGQLVSFGLTVINMEQITYVELDTEAYADYNGKYQRVPHCTVVHMASSLANGDNIIEDGQVVLVGILADAFRNYCAQHSMDWLTYYKKYGMKKEVKKDDDASRDESDSADVQSAGDS